jgi:hypothetical protein
MAESTNNNMTRDDLVLLMESYRNTISMHQAILDQSTKMVEMSNIIIGKLDVLTTKQTSLCNELSNIGRSIESTLKESEKRGVKLDDVVKTISDHEKNSNDEHHKITGKIYIGWIGMISIIISLIGLGYTIYNVMGKLHQ